MTTPHWLFGQVLEFNFLPSCTLHPSRFDSYAMPGLAQAIPNKPAWQTAWHRHWSRNILRKLELDAVHDLQHPSLMLALLRGRALTQLAHRLAAALCAPTLRYTISGDKVRALDRVWGDVLLTYARRDGTHHEQELPELGDQHVPQTLADIETLGFSILLASMSECAPALLRRVELKLPLDVQAAESPLSALQAWSLCVSILKDMDPKWCSSFPETR